MRFGAKHIGAGNNAGDNVRWQGVLRYQKAYQQAYRRRRRQDSPKVHRHAYWQTPQGTCWQASSSLSCSRFLVSAVLVFCAVLLVFSCSAISPATALAANSAFDDTSGQPSEYLDSYTGNAFLLNRDVANISVAGDLYWAGVSLNANAVEVGTQGGSMLAAGQTLMLSQASIQGSLRMAGETISVSNTEVGNNITVAGRNVSLASSVNARGVYAAGETLDVAGTYAGGAFAGGSITLTATFSGDVQLYASTITITKNTRIDGTLTVPSDATVVVEPGATIANTVTGEPLVKQTTGLDPIATLIGLCCSLV